LFKAKLGQQEVEAKGPLALQGNRFFLSTVVFGGHL